jgi:predicted RNA-binding protein with PIN domain
MSVYYIDGYNVIYHSSLLRPLIRQSVEIARDALIEKVEQFCSLSGERAKIFFDGRGQHAAPPTPSCHVAGLEIIFSHGDLSADAMIERMVYQSNRRRDIVVVSHDMGIRDLCRGLGAFVMGSENFIAKVRETRSDMGRTLSTKHQDTSVPRIEDRLDKDTLDRLSELKKHLPDK